MSWDYRRNFGTIPKLTHAAGTVPPRHLINGDTVTWPSGYSDTIYANTATLLMFDGRPGRPQFRKPIEGDDSDSIYAQDA